jgi:hypothetical protein
MSQTQKQKILYAGYECFFEVEVETTNEAQKLLDYYNKVLNYPACALHECGVHQIYVSKEKREIR